MPIRRINEQSIERFFRSEARRSTTRLGNFAPSTNTRTFACVTSMRARNQPSGSGTGCRVLELAGPFLAQFFPRVIRPRNVLDRTFVERCICLEIEGAKVHSLEGAQIGHVEGDAG